MENLKIFILPFVTRYVGGVTLLYGVFRCLLLIRDDRIVFKDLFSTSAGIDVYAIYAISILGCFLIIFSKEKTEDEFVNFIRLKFFLITFTGHSLFFFVFTFTSLTIEFIRFPAALLMISILFVYIIAFYIQKIWYSTGSPSD